MPPGPPARRSRPRTTSTPDFDAFYQQHVGAVRRFVARRVPPSDVEDVVSQAFTTAWRRWSDLPIDDALHFVWVRRIAEFERRNLRRADERREHRQQRAWVTARRPASEHPDQVIDSMIGTELLAALRALSPGDQLILMMSAWSDCTLDELADLLGCSTGAAKTRRTRARARFRKEWHGE